MWTALYAGPAQQAGGLRRGGGGCRGAQGGGALGQADGGVPVRRGGEPCTALSTAAVGNVECFLRIYFISNPDCSSTCCDSPIILSDQFLHGPARRRGAGGGGGQEQFIGQFKMF